MKTRDSDIIFERVVIAIGITVFITYIAIYIVIPITAAVFLKIRQNLTSAQEATALATVEAIEAVETQSEPTLDIPQSTAETAETEEIVTKTTLYDTLTMHEIKLLETTIQHEVGNFSKEYKTYVAELIYNRLVSKDFPDTIHDVLFQKGQFQDITFWSNSGIIPDEETKAVVKEVFSSEEPSHNCTFYYNPELSDYESIVWFEYSGDIEYVFSYKETSWGADYETRFFR